jgi:hypothetical protein
MKGTPMRKLKLFGSALTAALLLAAVVALPAWAVEAPVNLSPPKVGTTPEQGQLEQVTSLGKWSGSPTSYTYQWQRCNGTGGECASIAGATEKSYEVVGADVGHALVAKVTAHNAAGEGTGASTASAAALSAPEIVPNPSEKAGVQFSASLVSPIVIRATGIEVGCTSMLMTGQFVSATKATGVRVKFTHCPPLSPENLETELLTGRLEYLNRSKHEVALLLEPASGTAFLKHFYGGSEIQGSAIVSMAPVNALSQSFLASWLPSSEQLSLHGLSTHEGPVTIESAERIPFATSKKVEIKA